MEHQGILKSVFLLFVLSMLSSACGPKLLNANFAEIPSGSRPISSAHSSPAVLAIPGAPNGDLIYWTGEPVTGSGVQPFIINQNLLTYLQRPGNTERSLLGFSPMNSTHQDGYYNYMFDIQYRPTSNRLLNIRLTSDDNYNTETVLDIETRPIAIPNSNDFNHAVNLGDGQFLQDRPFGVLENLGRIDRRVRVTFFISINIEEKLYYISFLGKTAREGWRPLPFQIADLNTAPTLWFRWAEDRDIGGSAAFISFEKVEIFHGTRANTN